MLEIYIELKEFWLCYSSSIPQKHSPKILSQHRLFRYPKIHDNSRALFLVEEKIETEPRNRLKIKLTARCLATMQRSGCESWNSRSPLVNISLIRVVHSVSPQLFSLIFGEKLILFLFLCIQLSKRLANKINEANFTLIKFLDAISLNK